MSNIICATRKVGNYNWLDEKEKLAKHLIELPDGSPVRYLSVCVEPDSEYDYQDDSLSWLETDPWLVLDKLEVYVTKCWSTNKESQLNLIKWIRDNKQKLRPAWLQACIGFKQRRVKELQSIIDELDSELEELTNLAEE